MKGRPCVLIVEDDEMLRRSLRDLLHDEGFAVAEAVNGRAALDYLRQEPAPSVILLDLMMPVMTGREFLEHQLRDAALAKIPVVVLSAVDEASRAVSAQEHLSKPFRIEELLAALSRYC